MKWGLLLLLKSLMLRLVLTKNSLELFRLPKILGSLLKSKSRSQQCVVAAAAVVVAAATSVGCVGRQGRGRLPRTHCSSVRCGKEKILAAVEGRSSGVGRRSTHERSGRSRCCCGGAILVVAAVAAVPGHLSLDSHGRHRIELRLGFGAACLADTGSLDFYAMDPIAQELSPSQELFVVVASLVTSRSESGESIKVELSLEGSEFGLSKVGWHNVADELFRVVDHKAPAVWLPGNNVGVSVSLNLIQHFVQLDRKWNNDSALCGGT